MTADREMKETDGTHASEGAHDVAGTHVVGSRVVAAWEIASVTLSFLLVAWTVRPLASNSKLVGALPLALAVGLMLVSHRARGESARTIGWRLDNFYAAARLLVLPVACICVLIFLTGRLYGHAHSEKVQQWQWVLWLPAWALVQQYALQGFINRRAQILWGHGWRSVLLVAFVFAVLHLPNPWLTLITFAGGLLLAAVYQRAPNLLALALAHSLISLMLVWTLPAPLLRSLRIGFKYFG
jgi:membrane protease YdiL (CAAX protease family)